MSSDPVEQPVVDEDDVEGNAFKWELDKDASGKARLRQGWNAEDGPAGSRQPTKSNVENRPSQEGR